MYAINHLVLIVASLLLVSILASKISVKIGVPTLLFFLFIGILSNDDYFALLPFKSLEGAKVLGLITLVFVLFLGGLETDLKHVKSIWKEGMLLSTIATFGTAILVGYFLERLSGGLLSFWESFLVGAIIASTDAAAVFSILRSNNLRLKNNLGPLLEMESGTNDVMVYFLLTSLIAFIKDPSLSFYVVLPSFFQEMAVGALGGIALGYSMLFVMNRIGLSYIGLYPPLNIALVLLGYTLVNLFHGSGFLAVYLGGIILGNKNFVHRKSLLAFYKGMSWLMQIAMFIALGLLVLPHQLTSAVPWGIMVSCFLIFFGRPVGVFLALIFSKFNWKEKIFLSFGGVRGAVPIIFAIWLYELNQNRAHIMFHLIFFVVLVSIALQGTFLVPLAKWLDLAEKKKTLLKKIEEEEKGNFKGKIFAELLVPTNSPVANKPIVFSGIPSSVKVSVIHRGNDYFTNIQGSTIIKPEDRLFIILSTKRELNAVKSCLGVK